MPEALTHYPLNAVTWCLCIATVAFTCSAVMSLARKLR